LSSSPHWQFRRLTSADHKDVQSLILEISSTGPVVGFSWSVESLQTEWNEAECFVLVSAGQIVAYASLRPAGDAREITCLAVRPRTQRKGWGGLLLQSLFEQFENDAIGHGQSGGDSVIRELWLEVHDQNLAAQELYNRQGFMVTGRRNKYYPDGGAALLMSKSIIKPTPKLRPG